MTYRWMTDRSQKASTRSSLQPQSPRGTPGDILKSPPLFMLSAFPSTVWSSRTSTLNYSPGWHQGSKCAQRGLAKKPLLLRGRLVSCPSPLVARAHTCMHAHAHMHTHGQQVASLFRVVVSTQVSSPPSTAAQRKVKWGPSGVQGPAEHPLLGK